MNGPVASPGAVQLVGFTLLLVAVVVGAVLVYRSMQRPRLALVERPDGTLGADRRDVVRYALTIPLLIAAWLQFLVLILAMGSTRLSADEIFLVAGAIILATRLLAHVWQDPAHQLGKAVPMTLVTLVMLGTAARDEPAFEQVLDDLGQVDLSWQFLAIVLFADWLFTAAWYRIGVRWAWRRGWSVPGTTPRRDRTAPSSQVDEEASLPGAGAGAGADRAPEPGGQSAAP